MTPEQIAEAKALIESRKGKRGRVARGSRCIAHLAAELGMTVRMLKKAVA